MIDLVGKPCPVCGETRSSIVHQATYPEHKYPGTFTLRRCDGCGLLFNSPRLEGAELAQLYGKNYYFFLRNDSAELKRIVAMHQRTVAMIDAKIDEPRRSIDIGCGRGYLPIVLKRLGWEASGIEISPEAAHYARSHFGLKVFTGTVEQYAASADAGEFDLVTAIDVIEHVPSPDAFVAAAVKLVAPGGFLVIDTPNALAKNIARKGTMWKGFNPFHIYLFSIENLTALLARHGMNVQRSFSYGNAPQEPSVRDKTIAKLRNLGLLRSAVNVHFGLKKLSMMRGGSLDPDLDRVVSQIRTGISYSATRDASAPLSRNKTGDNIVVIAKKS